MSPSDLRTDAALVPRDLRAPQTPAALPGSAAAPHTRVQRAFTGRRAEHIVVTRHVAAPVAKVMAALGRVAPRAPYFLALKTLDGSIESGGLAGFRMPTAAAALVASPLAITGARTLEAEVVPASAEEQGGTRVTLRVPLADLATRFGRVGAATAVGGSALAGGVAVVVAKGLVAAALLGAPFAIAFGLTLPLGAALSRRIWQHREAQLHTLLGELADALALDVRVGGAFAAPAPPPASSDGSDGDVSAFIALGS